LDANYGKLPSAFEPNLGQTAPEVRFLTRGGGMTAFFTDTEAVMVLHKGEQPSHDALHRPDPPAKVEQAVVRMKLAGVTRPRRATGLEKLPGVSNYFIGNDPKKWRTDVPHYARIRYDGVYPGIDLVWYGNQRQLEYDFVVGPGADPNEIQVAYDGVESVGVEANGELVLRTALGGVRQQPPRVYQEIAGKRVEVVARYAIVARNRVRFELAEYDRKRELRIDPVVLIYSTYLGGGGYGGGSGIAVDAAGSAYVIGSTLSNAFPTQSPYQGASGGGPWDAVVTKLTPTGNALVYSTYLGGGGNDYGQGIVVDAAGSAYVTERTSSSNFPTQSPYQPTLRGGTAAFVTKLSSAGNALAYSTYLSGSGQDWGLGIAVDAAGSAYVTGFTSSTNFPTQSAYQATLRGSQNAFVTKLTPAGSALVYSTYLGGNTSDTGYGIAVDGAGLAYVTGDTYSTNFPTQSAYQATYRGSGDAFVTKLTAAGNALVYSTYLGGSSFEVGNGIAVDAAGSAYVMGSTQSADFPTQLPYQATYHGSSDAFVTKLSPAGNALVYSTYLGGNGQDNGGGIAVDSAGSAYVIGYTASTDFPTQSPYQATCQGGEDAFMTKLSPAGNSLVYSTYLGGSGDEYGNGIAVDALGSAYVTGFTSSTDFPIQSPYQATYYASQEGFVTKLGLPLSGTTVATNPTGLAIVADGFNQTAPQTFNWTPGSTHSIGVVSPQQSDGARYVFANWSDGGAQTHSVTVSSSATTYTASFTAEYLLTTGASPLTGGTITVSPTSPDGYYKSGSSVQLTATANPGYQFAGWSGDLTGSVNPQSVTMIATRSVIAVFVQVPGTTIATTPSGLAIVVDSVNQTAPQTFTWASGTVHSIGAISPQQIGVTRYVFANWSDGGAQTHSITTPSSATTYTANFTAAYPLTVTASPPDGGTVTANPTTLDGYYNTGSTVQLTATAGPGYQFDHWSGDLTGSVNPQSVTMIATRNVTAVFVLVPGTTVSTNPSGRLVVVDGLIQTAPQTFNWASGTVHTIGTYSPQISGVTRYFFANWSDGGAQSHSITTPPWAAIYTANFTAAYLLTTIVSPTAGGTVAVSPSSVDGYYSGGSSVQLTATANPGYRFDRWSGDLGGSVNPQSLVMGAPRVVAAVFTASGPVINAVVDSASGRPIIAPNSFVSIYGSNFTSWTGDWSGSAPNGVLPTTLGGVQVRINGKDCFVSYASPGQVNVVTPFDTATGSVNVQVVTEQGTVTSTATMAQVAPALFGYTLSSGRFYAVAQIANTTTIVAPAGTFGSAPARPAQAGDYVVLYAIGMGSTNPAPPAGQVLQTAYPVTDLSSVKVKFGSVDATVSWAGLVYAGEFQVNVLVPSGLSGDQPVVLTVGGQSTQPNAFLTFQ
jgi:uncharacterized protein (TIGR03437 family)